MSLLKRLASPAETRGMAGETQPYIDTTPPPPGMGGLGGSASLQINETTALAIPAVYACVDFLAGFVSTLTMTQSTGNRKNPTEVALSPVVEESWSEIPQVEFMTQLMYGLGLRGNFFGQVIERDRLGYPTQIMPWHNDRCSVRRLPSGVRQYKMGGTVVPTEDAFHVKAAVVPGALKGISPIEEVVRTQLQILRGSQIYGASWFKNAASPDSLLKIPGDPSPDKIEEVLTNWLSHHQGLANAHLPGIITGDVEYETLSIKPEDQFFLSAQQLGVGDVLAIYRCPPHALGYTDKTSSWGAGVAEQELGFVRNTGLVWLHRIASAYNRIIPKGQWVGFDLEERLAGDPLQRWTYYSLARGIGAMNVDEIRGREHMPPLPDGAGQTYLAPLNMGDLSDLANFGKSTNPPPPPASH